MNEPTELVALHMSTYEVVGGGSGDRVGFTITLTRDDIPAVRFVTPDGRAVAPEELDIPDDLFETAADSDAAAERLSLGLDVERTLADALTWIRKETS